MPAIEKVVWRKSAKARRAPYWKRYSKGRYIGWRKMGSGPGTWLARAWDGEKYPQKPLGDFGDKPEEERYDAALGEAVKWFQHLDMGGSTTPQSVKATTSSSAWFKSFSSAWITSGSASVTPCGPMPCAPMNMRRAEK